MGVDRGDCVKPPGYVCIGGFDTNDLDETEDYFDGGVASGYLDDRTGLILDEALTKQAEAEEMEFMQTIHLYDVVDSAECWEKTGKPPISTKWVRLNTGTPEVPDVRCRLVARDFKPKGEKDRSEIFAAMPPLESKKLLFQQAVTQNALNKLQGEDGIKIMLIDVKKAHLYGSVGEGRVCIYRVAMGGCQGGTVWSVA